MAAVVHRDQQELVQPLVDSLGITPADAQAYVTGATAPYDHNLARAGWRSTDLGDVATYYFVSAYGAYYHLSALPAAGVKRLRSGYDDALALAPQVRRLSNGHKQHIADFLQLNFIYYAHVADVADEADDFSLQDAALSALRHWVQRVYGVNLDKVAITRDGLVKR